VKGKFLYYTTICPHLSGWILPGLAFCRRLNWDLLKDDNAIRSGQQKGCTDENYKRVPFSTA